MKDEQEYVQDPTEDLRSLYAESVVADLEAYAKKRGLFLGRKEYVETDTWIGYDNTLHRRDKLQLDAILFSGIVSAINGLEYVMIYHSYNKALEFCMNRPDRRDTYAAGKGYISSCPGKDADHDFMFGSEFKCIRKAEYEMAEVYHDFGNLVSHNWSEHVSEGALDGMMAAFRESEEKHVRRQKNMSDLKRKHARIQDKEDALPNILDVLAPLVGGRDTFVGYSREICSSVKYPVNVDTELNTGAKDVQVMCNICYTAKRDRFIVNLHLGSAHKCDILSTEKTHWSAKGGIETVAEYIRFALGVAGIYDDTARRVAALKPRLQEDVHVDTGKIN